MHDYVRIRMQRHACQSTNGKLQRQDSYACNVMHAESHVKIRRPSYACKPYYACMQKHAYREERAADTYTERHVKHHCKSREKYTALGMKRIVSKVTHAKLCMHTHASKVTCGKRCRQRKCMRKYACKATQVGTCTQR